MSFGDEVEAGNEAGELAGAETVVLEVGVNGVSETAVASPFVLKGGTDGQEKVTRLGKGAENRAGKLQNKKFKIPYFFINFADPQILIEKPFTFQGTTILIKNGKRFSWK